MPDLNGEIRKLKGKWFSLRRIAATLNMSHEAVRKRLKNLEGKGKVSIIESERKLTASTIQNEKASTGSKAHESRASEESEVVVNLIPPVETPSHTLTEGVNPSGNPFLTLSEGAERGVSNSLNDLFGAIKEFLGSHGIELYRMNVEPEAYQVKCDNQTITFYVKRKIMERPKSPGTG